MCLGFRCVLILKVIRNGFGIYAFLSLYNYLWLSGGNEFEPYWNFKFSFRRISPRVEWYGFLVVAHCPQIRSFYYNHVNKCHRQEYTQNWHLPQFPLSRCVCFTRSTSCQERWKQQPKRCARIFALCEIAKRASEEISHRISILPSLSFTFNCLIKLCSSISTQSTRELCNRFFFSSFASSSVLCRLLVLHGKPNRYQCK